ncbi:MAG: hypothetical protein ACHQ1G_04400 [Planctomycetota bacterium]
MFPRASRRSEGRSPSACGRAEIGGTVLSWQKKLLFTAVLLLFAYLFAETIASILYVRGVVMPNSSIFLFEESSRTVAFDPVRGYRLSREPARFARITSGEICFTGELRGNNEGFPDRDDFGPARPDTETRRLAVLGDSFTSAQFLPCSWPDRAEDLAAEHGVRLQLLNFSLDGGGLLNWLSVLERHIIPSAYQLDGVVLPVFDSDLHRGFHIRDDSDPPIDAAGQRGHRLGYVYTWDLEMLPQSFAEAERHFYLYNTYILTHAEYERALRGEWKPVVSRPFRPFVLWQIVNKLGVYWGDGLPGALSREVRIAHRTNVDGRRKAVERMAQALKKLGVPVLVVRIPSRPELLGEEPDGCQEKRDLAAALGAAFVDGAEPFAGLTPDEIRAEWIHHDHHWNQAGSDRFARFIWQRLAREP